MHVLFVSRVAHSLVSRMLEIHTGTELSRFLSVPFLNGDDCGPWLRLLCPLLLLSFLCLLPRCLASTSSSFRGYTSHAWMRHVLHVARGSGTSSKSFLGQLRPWNCCSSPHLDKLLFSRSQTAPRSTRVGQPYWAEAEIAEELSIAAP